MLLSVAIRTARRYTTLCTRGGILLIVRFFVRKTITISSSSICKGIAFTQCTRRPTLPRTLPWTDKANGEIVDLVMLTGPQLRILTVWDVGGRDQIRALWQHYYPNTDGIVFAVDSTDVQRVGEASRELQSVMDVEGLHSIAFLILATKQDLPGALSPTKLASDLGLCQVWDRPWLVQPASAITGKGILEGFEWLSRNFHCASQNQHETPKTVKVATLQITPRSEASEGEVCVTLHGLQGNSLTAINVRSNVTMNHLGGILRGKLPDGPWHIILPESFTLGPVAKTERISSGDLWTHNLAFVTADGVPLHSGYLSSNLAEVDCGSLSDRDAKRRRLL